MKNTKITIIGGASTYTPGIFASLIQNKKDLSLTEVNLFDHDKDNLIKMQKYLNIYVSQRKIDVQVTIAKNLQEAVTNSKFIFVQIRVGGNKMRQEYEEIAMKNGVVGQETCGAGGFAFAMAQIESLIEIIETAKKYAPEAWVINYSNPIAIVSEAISRETDASKVLWICDGPVGDAEAYLEIIGRKKEDFVWDHIGVNHFWWYTSIRDKITNKEYIDIIRDKFINAKIPKDDSGWYKIREKIKWYLTRLPELLPTSYLQYYFFSNKSLNKQIQDGHTRAHEVIHGRQKDIKDQIEQTIAIGQVDKEFKLGVHGEFIVDYAIAIHNNKKTRLSVNLRNNGYIKSMPDDWIIEAPGYVDASGAKFVKKEVEQIDEYYLDAIRSQKKYALLVYKAWKKRDYNIALKALTANKMVNNLDIAENILNEYIDKFSNYWPKIKK